MVGVKTTNSPITEAVPLAPHRPGRGARCIIALDISCTREQGADYVPGTYCYSGAGFYNGIWEEILQESVDIELLSNVLQGNEVCSFAIYLPAAH